MLALEVWTGPSPAVHVKGALVKPDSHNLDLWVTSTFALANLVPALILQDYVTFSVRILKNDFMTL